jgi:hypothetical protein
MTDSPPKAPAGLVKKIYGKAIQSMKFSNSWAKHWNSYILVNNLKLMGELFHRKYPTNRLGK